MPLALPTTLDLPSDIDLSKPTQIGDWYGLQDPGKSQFWCESANPIHVRLSAVRLLADPTARAMSENVLGDDGQRYATLDYMAGAHALHAIFKYRYRVNGGAWTTWQPWDKPVVDLPEIRPSTTSTSVAVDVRAHFVAGPGRANGHWINTNMITATVVNGGQPVASKFTAAPFDIVAASGASSSKLVDLGDVPVGTLIARDSHTPARPFRLALSNGPSGMSYLQYELDATSIVHGDTDNFIAPDNATIASGIGLRVADSSGNGVTYGQQQRSERTSQSGARCFDLPFTAAWYRTGVLTSGYASADMTFTIIYP
ncbi:fimbrial protein [Burkholderia pyrrocinia]